MHVAKTMHYDVMKIAFRHGVYNKYGKNIYVFAYINRDKWIYEPFTFGPIYPNQEKKLYIYQKRYTPSLEETKSEGFIVDKDVKLHVEYRVESESGEVLESLDCLFDVYIFDLYNPKFTINEYGDYDYVVGDVQKLMGGTQGVDTLRIYTHELGVAEGKLKFESEGAKVSDEWMFPMWPEDTEETVMEIYPAWPDESIKYSFDLGYWIKQYILVAVKFSPLDGCWLLGNIMQIR